ncbi:MAG: transcriptional regulator [Prochlorococcaceae cyanobacterium]
MSSFRFGPYTLNSDSILWCEGSMVHLPPMERRMLRYFCEHAQRLNLKEDVMQAVWGHQSVSDVSLSRTIHGLRRKLSHPSLSDKLIQTVYSQGFIFTQPVEVLEEAHEASLARFLMPMPA